MGVQTKVTDPSPTAVTEGAPGAPGGVPVGVVTKASADRSLSPEAVVALTR
jgi:hypothetical protein